MYYTAIITNGRTPCGTAISPEVPETAIPLAAALGYNGLQLTIASAEDYDIPQLKALCREYGMRVTALATGRVYTVEGYSMGSGDEENRKMSVERLCSLVDVGEVLDHAILVIGACRGKTSDAPTPEIYHRQFEKSMREVCNYAASRCVPVILELIDYLESDCCNRIPELTGYLERLGDPNLHMYLDTMHQYIEQEDITALMRDYGGTIPQVDISGENRCCISESVIDFGGALTALKKTGFDGILNFEMDIHGDIQNAKDNLAFVKKIMEKSV